MPDYPEGSPEPLARQAQEGFRIEGPPCAPERAWTLIGDTDWMNRRAEAGAVVKLDIESQRDGFPMLRGQLAGPLGLKLPFLEVWSSWVAGRFFRQVRDIESPVIARSDYRAELVPIEGSALVKPVIEMQLTGPGWASGVRRGLSLSKMRRLWEGTLERLTLPIEGEDPARELGPEAAAAVRRWAGVCDPAVVSRFDHHFRFARPTDLSRLRAFDLADRWGLPRDAVLDALLGALGVGAVELFWSVRCSRCYGQVAGGRLLSDLADHAECAGCQVRTDVDMAANVEVLFAPHPSVATQLDVNYCTVFPKASPSQVAVLTMLPGQRVSAPIQLPQGAWTFGPGHGVPDMQVTVGQAGSDTLAWDAGHQAPSEIRAGTVTLDVTNGTADRQRVFLTRVGGGLPMVPASLLTTKESFRRQLGHQVLAPDLRVGVRSIALVFTDLSGSTAMYEELGDARAFSVVRDHFIVLRKAAARNNGTIVKTIGDAVMAAFYDAPAAMAGAFDMLEEFNAWVGTVGLENPPSLKVGVHVGAALVVHSDQAGLDYFGGSVNLAARAQGAAEAGEVVWTDAVQAQERAREVVAQRGYVATPLTKLLKGIGDVRLWRASRTPPEATPPARPTGLPRS